MARPLRADTPSTRIIGFRLTEDEEARLDELVRAHGHRDRSALLRAWLEQGSPVPQSATSEHKRPSLSIHENGKSEVSLDEPNEDQEELVLLALRGAEDSRLKLIRLPGVIRSLQSRLALAAIHKALLALAKSGKIELRPEAGNELLRPDDAAICPPGPRGTVLAWARFP